MPALVSLLAPSNATDLVGQLHRQLVLVHGDLLDVVLAFDAHLSKHRTVSGASASDMGCN